MGSKIKATALLLCAAIFITGCKKTPDKASSVSKTVPDSPVISSEVSEASSEESAPSVPEAPTESAASSKPQVSSKPAAQPSAPPAPVSDIPGYPVPETVPESGVPFTAKSYSDDELMQLDNTRNGYGHGNKKDNANRPTVAMAAQERVKDYGGVFIAPPSNYVFLTFDLGYENGYTSKILDTLAQRNAKGVFFVTMSYCKSAPAIVERIIREGHVLGNHSVSHKSMPSLSIAEMKNEIMELHDYIKNTYGYDMFLFRPPMGEYSIRTVAVAQSLGYQTMNWSFAYKDWDTKNQPEENYARQKMIDDAHGGAVYLIHAVSKTNAAVLGSVIDGIRAKGFETAKYVKITQ